MYPLKVVCYIQHLILRVKYTEPKGTQLIRILSFFCDRWHVHWRLKSLKIAIWYILLFIYKCASNINIYSALYYINTYSLEAHLWCSLFLLKDLTKLVSWLVTYVPTECIQFVQFWVHLGVPSLHPPFLIEDVSYAIYGLLLVCIWILHLHVPKLHLHIQCNSDQFTMILALKMIT